MTLTLKELNQIEAMFHKVLKEYIDPKPAPGTRTGPFPNQPGPVAVPPPTEPLSQRLPNGLWRVVTAFMLAGMSYEEFKNYCSWERRLEIHDLAEVKPGQEKPGQPNCETPFPEPLYFFKTQPPVVMR